MKLLLTLSLLVAPVTPLTPSHALKPDFDTYQTADKYLEDFDYLIENTYRISSSQLNGVIEYGGHNYRFYALPIYYEVNFSDRNLSLYYENNDYQFFAYSLNPGEVRTNLKVDNYIGIDANIPFIAIDYLGMLKVMELNEEIKTNTIYDAIAGAFLSFFPASVVEQYGEVFTFFTIAFMLALLIGLILWVLKIMRRVFGLR